jgi:hypothetical protein
MSNIWQSTGLDEVDEDGNAQYDGEGTSTEGGDLQRIQCHHCGSFVANSYEELVEKARSWGPPKPKSKSNVPLPTIPTDVCRRK